jgi:hypothetical protein
VYGLLKDAHRILPVRKPLSNNQTVSNISSALQEFPSSLSLAPESRRPHSRMGGSSASIDVLLISICEVPASNDTGLAEEPF